MAPGTNLGAASPVAIGGSSPQKGEEKKDKAADAGDTMMRKQVHDAAAYIRSLAQLRGRNAEWGERAVREAVSLSADDALKEHAIDLTARDVPDLVAKLDGRKLNTASGERVLATANTALVP